PAPLGPRLFEPTIEPSDAFPVLSIAARTGAVVQTDCHRYPFLTAEAFHRVAAKGRVLTADLQRLLIVLAIVPSLQNREAIRLLDGDALWRRTIKRGNRYPSP